MYKYVIKRLLLLIPVMLGVSFIIFSIMNLTPGDPASLLLGEDQNEQAIERLREELGLNEPFLVRYVKYVGDALRGDFGISYRSKEPVFDVIFARFPYTLRLAAMAILISALFGVLIGILTAVKQYSAIDNAVLGGTLIVTSMPNFWLGMMLIILFTVKLGILPATGAESWYSYIMPGLAASGSYMANIIRMTRSSMLEVLRQDYVRTAKAKGANRKTVVYKHALRNALLPIVTLIGMNIGWQLGGTIVVEQVFAIPGIGTLMLTSIRSKDIPVVTAGVVFVCLLAGVINLATDIVYAYIDPRVKSQYVKE